MMFNTTIAIVQVLTIVTSEFKSKIPWK